MANQKWEHIIQIDTDIERVKIGLNEASKQGWELVSIAQTSAGFAMAFKRPKEGQ